MNESERNDVRTRNQILQDVLHQCQKEGPEALEGFKAWLIEDGLEADDRIKFLCLGLACDGLGQVEETIKYGNMFRYGVKEGMRIYQEKLASGQLEVEVKAQIERDLVEKAQQ